jgi:spore germination protein YaaH
MRFLYLSSIKYLIMSKTIASLLFFFIVLDFGAQNEYISIHQEQQAYFNSLGLTDDEFDSYYTPADMSGKKSKRNCELDKIVFGWHPFWSNALYVNYDWSLLSDLSYFSYEVDANTGDAITTHNFMTNAAVTEALNNDVRVNLCVTLFSDHATFFNSPTAEQNLISNLISLIQSRGAHGVNIDFESMASSVSSDYTAFIINLSQQMKASIPNCQISLALHAVDWSGFYDIQAMEPHVDLFCIMGYDYYWQGSSFAGPNDPLYNYTYNGSYNYTLSRSTTYYENQGAPKNKIILGLPYYGRQWPVVNHSLPASTTGNGTATFYRNVKSNISGNFTSANRNTEPISRSVYYNYFDNGTPWQHFIAEENELGERMDFSVKRGLGGIGIWALGYDDGYTELWDEIENHLTDCSTDPCEGEVWDIGGGPFTNYYSGEDYVFTLSPQNAVQVDVEFTEFNAEAGYDFLYVYDGNSTTSPQINGSPFTGGSLPSSFSSSTGDLTFSFVSDNNTVGSGFRASYTCISDNTPPLTEIEAGNDWKTDDFLVDFADSDNVGGVGIDRRFYHVGHFDGAAWRANENRGFLNDYFNQTLHSDWSNINGNWSTSSGVLIQTDESLGNTNLSTPLNQSLSNLHLYHFQAKIGGTGTNRRGGLHFFCDDDQAVNRGNSYFVWLRVDQNILQFYKVENDNFGSPVINVPYSLDADTWYDIKVSYDRIEGDVTIYIDDQLAASWTDPNPIVTGDFVSWRSGNCVYEVDDFTVYRTRFPSVTVNVGPGNNDDIQYQNLPVNQAGGRILSIVRDNAHNFSAIEEEWIDIDWSAPIVDFINDGSSLDEDTVFTQNPTIMNANWSANDPNSAIADYLLSIGTSPWADDVVNWQSVGSQTSENISSGNYNYDEWYFINLIAQNGAGLEDSIHSNGFRFLYGLALESYSLKDLPVLYPNPSSGLVNIQSQLNNIKAVKLYDAQGRLIDNWKVNSNTFTDSFNELSSGIYTFRVLTEKAEFELKWTKM